MLGSQSLLYHTAEFPLHFLETPTTSNISPNTPNPLIYRITSQVGVRLLLYLLCTGSGGAEQQRKQSGCSDSTTEINRKFWPLTCISADVV